MKKGILRSVVMMTMVAASVACSNHSKSNQAPAAQNPLNAEFHALYGKFDASNNVLAGKIAGLDLQVATAQKDDNGAIVQEVQFVYDILFQNGQSLTVSSDWMSGEQASKDEFQVITVPADQATIDAAGGKLTVRTRCMDSACQRVSALLESDDVKAQYKMDATPALAGYIFAEAKDGSYALQNSMGGTSSIAAAIKKQAPKTASK